MDQLGTARLVLEPLREAHADELFGGLSDARLYAHMPGPPPASVAELRARHRRLEARRSPDGSERWLNWALRARDDGRLVGYVQATVFGDGGAEVAYVLLYAEWGRGLAREATQRMIDHLHERFAVRRFRATVDLGNRRSTRLLGALGFTRSALRGEEVEYQLARA
jgi:ribosomal-protein-alanine N-acetyltransferase